MAQRLRRLLRRSGLNMSGMGRWRISAASPGRSGSFCQKVLVYQAPGGQAEVLFNDMSALSELHYGGSALPHKVITRRMRDTLVGAVEK